MEHESFEDTTVARLMNDHFVCIKVDREERPDIDHVYMTAVHLMNQQGGWPLNCIALPDGRPIWGATYLPREQWMEALLQVSTYYREHPDETSEYAARLSEGIKQNSIFTVEQERPDLGHEEIHRIVGEWTTRFDPEYGGSMGSPKFPMPVNLEFLMHYGVQYHNRDVLDHVELTLDKMARGGIYDQAGGGFARYSVDPFWKVPHFEKMLYDNAQLLRLYARAYQVFGKEQYGRVIRQSVEFLERQMISPEGAFYSALDADSEGEEGKYYVWTREELEQLTGTDFELFSRYYGINETGLWEDDRYILYRTTDPDEFAEGEGMDPGDFLEKVSQWNEVLLKARSRRIPPGLDDKSLTSWSSLMTSGLVAAYRALGDPHLLELALTGAELIRNRLWTDDGMLFRNYKNGERSIPGFLIDYALYTETCLDLFETSLDPSWLLLAEEVTSATLDRFYDQATGMFNYNASGSPVLISHNVEIQDNVIPSSNAVMAHNLFRLGHMLTRKEYLEMSAAMTANISNHFAKYPHGFACWGTLLLKQLNPYYEIAVVGQSAPAVLKVLAADYLPHVTLAGSAVDSDFPLFNDRFDMEKTRIFVCQDNVCRLPVENPEDAKAIYHIR
jgi:uncharacterized protein YyaL (SSP411 family)